MKGPPKASGVREYGLALGSPNGCESMWGTYRGPTGPTMPMQPHPIVPPARFPAAIEEARIALGGSDEDVPILVPKVRLEEFEKHLRAFFHAIEDDGRPILVARATAPHWYERVSVRYYAAAGLIWFSRAFEPKRHAPFPFVNPIENLDLEAIVQLTENTTLFDPATPGEPFGHSEKTSVDEIVGIVKAIAILFADDLKNVHQINLGIYNQRRDDPDAITWSCETTEWEIYKLPNTTITALLDFVIEIFKPTGFDWRQIQSKRNRRSAYQKVGKHVGVPLPGPSESTSLNLARRAVLMTRRRAAIANLGGFLEKHAAPSELKAAVQRQAHTPSEASHEAR